MISKTKGIAKLIKYKRLLKGWTFDDMFDQVNGKPHHISRATLVNIEVGNQKPRTATIKNLAVLFDMSYEDFLKESREGILTTEWRDVCIG